ncbi:hypothetical protein Droror1_Dr00024385 [Drosera rotundifolia]
MGADLPITPEPPLDFGHGEEDIANPVTFSDFADSEGDSSDLESPSEDEEEEVRRKRRFTRFKGTEGEEVVFKIGQDNTQLLQPEQRTEATAKIPVGSQAPQSQNATQSQPPPSQSQPP